MPAFVCCTCAAQYGASDEPPERCLICSDDRQYVSPQGQRWTTREELTHQGYRNLIGLVEPAIHSITVEPKLGIGQQAFLVQTPHGNVLWDCLGLLHPDFVREVAALGGIQAIACSHPHFYAACVDWAETFGCNVFLPEVDREWVTRQSTHLEFWQGGSKHLLPGLELIRLGGHFPGSSMMLWHDGCEGRGCLFAGDTLFPTPDRKWVSLMYSFPNLVPLPAEQVVRIRAVMQQYSFDRLYGAFPHTMVPTGAAEVVQRSLDRYCSMLGGSLPKTFY